MPSIKNTSFQDVLLAAEGGRLYLYNSLTDRLVLLFQDDNNETLMGLARDGEHLYLGAKSRLFKLHFIGSPMDYLPDPIKATPISDEIPDFHQINIIDGSLYATATAKNEIWKFDLDLNLERIYRLRPPRRFLPIKYKQNYNHLNSIFKYNGTYYVCLNWLTAKQYGPSGFSVLNNYFKEIQRIEYGWEAHNFALIDGKRFVLCGSSGAIKGVGHTHKAGLMVNGALVYEHDPNLWFCKDFSVADNYILLVDGQVRKRNQRTRSNGVIFALNKKYHVLSEVSFSGSGGFCGCLFPNKDLTKNNHQENIEPSKTFSNGPIINVA